MPSDSDLSRPRIVFFVRRAHLLSRAISRYRPRPSNRFAARPQTLMAEERPGHKWLLVPEVGLEPTRF